MSVRSAIDGFEDVAAGAEEQLEVCGTGRERGPCVDQFDIGEHASAIVKGN